MSSAVARAVMSDDDYDRERARLVETYGDGSSADLSAKRDQAMAILFHRSGWTQEMLAQKEDKSQRWMAYHLCFGRFLEFSTTVLNSENPPSRLTEGRFRAFWEKTDKNETNERIRFRQALDLMRENIGIAVSPRHGQRLGIGPDVIKRFGDGEWHHVDDVIEATGKGEEDVVRALDLMVERGTYNTSAEKRRRGRNQHLEYRIFPKKKTVSSTELTTKLGPIIELLKAEGKKNMATMVPATVAMLAVKLQHLLDEWTA